WPRLAAVAHEPERVQGEALPGYLGDDESGQGDGVVALAQVLAHRCGADTDIAGVTPGGLSQEVLIGGGRQAEYEQPEGHNHAWYLSLCRTGRSEYERPWRARAGPSPGCSWSPARGRRYRAGQ